MNKRIYPVQPLLGIGAVIIKDNRFLLVKRKYEPYAHFWTLPGGLVELGEYVHEAVIREIREECGIKVKPTKIVDVIDYIEKDEKAKIKYHYVLIES
ncbi:MAG: NUDIX hydrolase [bacterium]